MRDALDNQAFRDRKCELTVSGGLSFEDAEKCIAASAKESAVERCTDGASGKSKRGKGSVTRVSGSL